MNFKLNPHQRSDAAAKQILVEQFLILQNNTQPLIDDKDTECLHDFRIAVRRTRVLLNQLPGIFPQRTTVQFQKKFKQLGTITTQMRDLDVLLSEFSGYRAMISKHKRNYLETLKTCIQQQRDFQFKRLKHYLRSRSHGKLIHHWQVFLDKPCPKNTRLQNALLPIDEFLSARTWHWYRRVLRDGAKITDETAAEKLHALRKNCKTLRYLIEFGSGLHSKKKLKKATKIMKRLQNILGKHQDLHVHINYLRKFESLLAQDESLNEETTEVIQNIIDRLNLQQMQCRDKFQKAFAEFSSETNQVFFAALFKSR